MSAASMWHRWQLTAPLAALSRPLKTPPVTGTVPDAPSATDREGFPVLLGGARARQVDETTCGSAVLVMMAATGDPVLAEWLETGRVPRGTLPPEIPRESVTGLDAAGRFAAAQRQVKRRTGRRALGPLPWPASLGTPPWTAAREARFPGVRYRVRPFDDATDDAQAVLAQVVAATHRGHPVPMFTGGDLRGGIAHAVPRHVVLAVPPPPGAGEPGMLSLYEPGRGEVYRVPAAALVDRTTPHPALGGWTHVTVALLPVPA
ncbi:hypothetical protein V2J52_10035 [Georgenia sp. MJ173]|uniref:hypothetical protein n=1 Tax=Georgenia sunbinii TaxID=3117728 RepID=UPI002F26C07C